MALLLAVLCLALPLTHAAPVVDQPPPSLYNQTTDVGIAVLTAASFNQTLFPPDAEGAAPATGPLIWFVQFYNSWCGHCQRFAPTFKSLANHTLAWTRHLRLAVMDCALRDHAPLCNHYNVQSFPTMHFLPPHTPRDGPPRGEAYVGPHTEAGTYHGILDYVEKTGFPAECAALPPGALDAQWEGVKETQMALVVEAAGEDQGKDVVLSVLGQTPQLAVRRATSVNAALVASLDSGQSANGLWFISKSGEKKKHQFAVKDPKVHDYVAAIFAEDDRLAASQNLPALARTPVPYAQATARPTPAGTTSKDAPAKPHIAAPLRPLNMTDLHSALVYLFSMEINSHSHIAGADLAALHLFTGLLDDLIPFPSPVYNAVQKLRQTLQSTDQTEAASIINLLKETGLDVEHAPLQWANCQGSQSGKRGYPCALWQLFHTLTLRYYEKNRENAEANALAKESGVLRGIFGLVGRFFSCSECRDNFMREANALSSQTEVLSPRNAVLWLWRVHNGVNKRLAGDVTEDDNYPKQQFPPATLCPGCRDADGQWREDEVLQFLRAFYAVHGNAEAQATGS
ncbi:sulfhydryl oxidase 1-like isoform X2 [Paramacrobiotus metropolitanus]|uniref:sulfhydryl oxidase 1-like isoform X2 n=1 Tax=Paramacrobiotus metropolitanus TaxID=2943436 RepID=UPI002445F478|nr:sulfhydryl oxidase 1-like isoform X2 [Paramacrobiotus metropolitanus]